MGPGAEKCLKSEFSCSCMLASTVCFYVAFELKTLTPKPKSLEAHTGH